MPTSSCSPSQAGHTDGSAPQTLFAVTHTATFGTLSRPRLMRSSRPAQVIRPGALLLAAPVAAQGPTATPSPTASGGTRPGATATQPSPTGSYGLPVSWPKKPSMTEPQAVGEATSPGPISALVLPQRRSSRPRSQGTAPAFINPFATHSADRLPVPQQEQPLGVHVRAHKSAEEVASRGKTEAAAVWPPEEANPASDLLRPVIVAPPTLGVVPMVVGGRSGPQLWPQFMARLGEVSYLCAYPGEKRRDRCADWLRMHGHGPIDGLLGKDISEVTGSQQILWLVSPTVKVTGHKKMRYAVNRLGQWQAVLEVQSTEAVVQHIERAMGRRSLSLYGEDPIATLSPHWGQQCSAIHFAHSLVMGELFGHHEVADVVNLHGKLYGLVTLYDSVSVPQLLLLAQGPRKVFARRMFLSLSKILRDMHLRQAVHFNVCLGNVLLALSSCTLSGFLSSHFIGVNGMPSERLPTHEPPEMAAHKNYDLSVDVWGLGMALMRLLCGEQAFLVAHDTPHDQGLSQDTWQAYIDWHASQQGHEAAGFLALANQKPASPLHDQLDRGLAAAAATDKELAHFVVQHMIVPGVDRRLQKDALVSRAAQFCQAIPIAEQQQLDDVLAKSDPPVAPHPRPDILDRMRRLLPVWRSEA